MENNDSESRWLQIQKRLSLQNISKFVKHGSVPTEADSNNYSEREETAYKTLAKYLEKNCSKDNLDELLENIIAYSSVREDICFEQGMRAGAQIMAQLVGGFESDFPGAAT